MSIWRKMTCEVTANLVFAPTTVVSCETHMVRVVDDVLGEIDRGNVVAVVQIDLSAAFDTIYHPQLLKRLEKRFGIRSTILEWFTSYLNDRSYKVKIGDALSPRIFFKYGVPQGSLLGLVLFALYVEPLEPIVKKETIENCLEEVRTWMIENRLVVNEDKTEFLLLGKRKKMDTVREESDLTLELNGNIISPMDMAGNLVKTLGIYLDEQMDMKRQISMVKRNAGVTMRNLWQIRRFIDKPLRLILAQLVISKVDYCNALYFNLPASTIKPLKGLMNQVIRYIHGVREMKVDLDPFYRDSHILTIEKRISFKSVYYRTYLAPFSRYFNILKLVYKNPKKLDQKTKEICLEHPSRVGCGKLGLEI
eukprot:sb/3465939/